jgi:predicted nucleic acid-binding protein
MGATEEVGLLAALLGRLDLYDVDRSIADAASAFGAKYRLRAADAVHLATAVHVGADRFITNNSRDFPKSIGEIEIVYPDDLA